VPARTSRTLKCHDTSQVSYCNCRASVYVIYKQIHENIDVTSFCRSDRSNRRGFVLTVIGTEKRAVRQLGRLLCRQTADLNRPRPKPEMTGNRMVS
jgi:hypothetical protein